MIRTCEFKQVDEYHVKCPACGKHLSGTPEGYEGKVICSAFGVGTIVSRKLQTLANTFHMTFNECPACITLKSQMNINGVDWTESNASRLVDMISSNAKKLGVIIPKTVLNKVLASAIKEERDTNG